MVCTETRPRLCGGHFPGHIIHVRYVFGDKTRVFEVCEGRVHPACCELGAPGASFLSAPSSLPPSNSLPLTLHFNIDVYWYVFLCLFRFRPVRVFYVFYGEQRRQRRPDNRANSCVRGVFCFVCVCVCQRERRVVCACARGGAGTLHMPLRISVYTAIPSMCNARIYGRCCALPVFFLSLHCGFANWKATLKKISPGGSVAVLYTCAPCLYFIVTDFL